MFAAYFQICLWTIAAENQARRIREQYLHAILLQDMGWHDAGSKEGEPFATRMSGDAEMIHDGIADNSTKGLTAYSRAGTIAKQAIASIRTVVSYGGQNRELREYSKHPNGAYAAAFYLSQQLRVQLTTSTGQLIAIPSINTSNPGGAKPSNVQGRIVVKDVDFAYPVRPDVRVLYKMHIEVKPAGLVTLDNVDVKGYNVAFLRDISDIVSQEPALFNASIRHNIAMRIHVNTQVGERGALLSGGQKQCIAIARALIKDPQILQLDEATCALETESERVMQDALDKAVGGRSTVTVVHRLSAVMNADGIYVMEKDIVKETSTHKSLLGQRGMHSGLVAKQQLRVAGEEIIINQTTSTIPSAVTHQVPSAENVSQNAAKVAPKSRRSSMMGAKERKSLDMAEHRFDSVIGIDDGAVELEFEKNRKEHEKVEIFKRQSSPLLRVLKSMKPEMGLAIFGAVMAGMIGANWPIFAKISAEAINATTNLDSLTFRKDANF
ncbi:Multidrug resistance protein 1 [Mortierella claussenii]|nr:Multidrug resistance protein 1 [Mortierella claussenii]